MKQVVVDLTDSPFESKANKREEAKTFGPPELVDVEQIALQQRRVLKARRKINRLPLDPEQEKAFREAIVLSDDSKSQKKTFLEEMKEQEEQCAVEH